MQQLDLIFDFLLVLICFFLFLNIYQDFNPQKTLLTFYNFLIDQNFMDHPLHHLSNTLNYYLFQAY